MENIKYDLIVSIVKRGHADYVISSAKSKGATGATIITARGSNVGDNMSFMGINVQAEKEIVLILAKTESRSEIMREICDQVALDLEGNGLCFSVPVLDTIGISHVNRTDLNSERPRLEKEAKLLIKNAKIEAKKQSKTKATKQVK